MFCLSLRIYLFWTFHINGIQQYGLPWWLNGKESACNAGDAGSIPGSGRPLKKKMATHASTLAWEIPWTEEHGGLPSTGHKESVTTETTQQQLLGLFWSVRFESMWLKASLVYSKTVFNPIGTGSNMFNLNLFLSRTYHLKRLNKLTWRTFFQVITGILPEAFFSTLASPSSLHLSPAPHPVSFIPSPASPPVYSLLSYLFLDACWDESAGGKRRKRRGTDESL